MKNYFAELVGTFVLVFGGVGSAVIAGEKIGYVGVSLAFGLALVAMVYAIGPISGCHINPAVTLAAWLNRKIPTKDALAYVAAQILGGIAAAAVILFVAQSSAGGYDPAQSGLGANGYGEHSPGYYTLAAAFVVELILTMFLVLTVLGATDTRAPVGFAGLAIGLVLTLIHLVGIPVTNTSVNPARSIGPALLAGGWAIEQLWVFIVAPSVGALAATAIYRAIRLPAAVITTREAEQALPSEQVEKSSRRRAA